MIIVQEYTYLCNSNYYMNLIHENYCPRIWANPFMPRFKEIKNAIKGNLHGKLLM